MGLIFLWCGLIQLGLFIIYPGHMANRIQHFRRIIQEQSTAQVSNSTANRNRAKINFGPSDKPERKYYDNLIESEAIDPWNTNTYSRQEDIRGLRRLMQSNKRKKKNAINFIHRAAITSKSWSAERERLLHLRQQMHIPTPVFQPSDQPKDEGIFTYLRGKGEEGQVESKKNSTSQSSRSFRLQKKLLSRIYSHSYEPQIMIKKIPLSQYREDMHESKPSGPSLKFKKNSYIRKEKVNRQEQNQDESEYWQVKKLVKGEEFPDVKIHKSKSIGCGNQKKQRLKIV